MSLILDLLQKKGVRVDNAMKVASKKQALEDFADKADFVALMSKTVKPSRFESVKDSFSYKMMLNRENTCVDDTLKEFSFDMEHFIPFKDICWLFVMRHEKESVYMFCRTEDMKKLKNSKHYNLVVSQPVSLYYTAQS